MPNFISKLLSKGHSRDASTGASLSTSTPFSRRASEMTSAGTSHPSAGQASSSSSSTMVNAIYYPNWAVYRPLPPSALDLSCVTHVLYAFLIPEADGTLASTDEYADYEKPVDGVQGGLAALALLKKAHPRVKVLISLGGGGQGSEHFPALARSPAARDNFCQAVRAVVDAHGLDGADLDWEHPSGSEDRGNFLALVRELRRAMPDSLLTAAVPAVPATLQHYPLAKAQGSLDLVLVMAYDLAGPWSEVSGHHAALFEDEAGSASGNCGAGAVAYLKSRCGVPARKCVLGVPAYGRFFAGAGSVGRSFQKHPGQKGQQGGQQQPPRRRSSATVGKVREAVRAGSVDGGGVGDVGPGTAAEINADLDAADNDDPDAGVVEYRALPRANAMEWVDGARAAAYCVGTDGFTSYDNQASVAAKARWARAQGLAGLFYWTVLGDDGRRAERSLVRAGWEAMH